MGGGGARFVPPPPPPLPMEEQWFAPPPPPLPPQVLTCAGITKQGLRCRINWALNERGFCKYHEKQQHAPLRTRPPRLPSAPPLAPPPRKPAKAPPRHCAGTTKQGLPCQIAWQLDALGFCKYHTQLTRQCRGVAVSTGQRCRIRWDLDAKGYCQYHASQADAGDNESSTSQCVALARSTGQRCRITTGLDARGLCSVHQRTSRTTTTTTSSQRRCGGVVFLTGACCTNDAKPNYAYCCAAHDPSLQYFSPRLFDAGDRPRSLLEPQVVRLYAGRDLYHGDLLDLVTPGAVELDHILEKQCFAFAFHGMPLSDVASDTAYLAAIVREEFANELDNLCLTRTTTNKIKGSAVWKFLDDTLTGHVTSGSTDSRLTFTDYMLAEQRDAARLDRTTTRVITREMGRALKTCRRKLADQDETPLIDSLSEQLQRVYATMNLHSASQSPSSSKYDAAAKPSLQMTESTQDDRQERILKSKSSTSKLTETVHAKPFVPGQGVLLHREVNKDSGDSEVTCSRGELKAIANKAPWCGARNTLKTELTEAEDEITSREQTHARAASSVSDDTYEPGKAAGEAGVHADEENTRQEQAGPIESASTRLEEATAFEEERTPNDCKSSQGAPPSEAETRADDGAVVTQPVPEPPACAEDKAVGIR